MTENIPTTTFESVLGTLTRLEDRDLPHAYEHALQLGEVLTAPEVMKVRAARDNSPAWEKVLTSTELLEGKIADHDVVLVVHGGNFLSPDRIREAYEQTLTKEHAVALTQEEFVAAYNGETNAGTLRMYAFDDFLQKKPEGKYGVFLERDRAGRTKSVDGYTSLCCLTTLPLMIAVAGGKPSAENYTAATERHFKSGFLGFHHKYKEVAFQPQGRLLFLCDCDTVGIKLDYNMASGGKFLTRSS